MIFQNIIHNIQLSKAQQFALLNTLFAIGISIYASTISYGGTYFRYYITVPFFTYYFMQKGWKWLEGAKHRFHPSNILMMAIYYVFAIHYFSYLCLMLGMLIYDFFSKNQAIDFSDVSYFLVMGFFFVIHAVYKSWFISLCIPIILAWWLHRNTTNNS